MRQLFRPMPGEIGFRAPATGVEIALAALAVVSTAVTVMGTISQGQAAADAASRQAEMRRRAADAAEEQGRISYARQQRLNLINQGKSLSALAGSGVDVFEGSPLDLLSQQAAEGEYQAETKKFEYDQRAWMLRMGAANDEIAGQAAMTTATGKAAGAALGGFGKIAGPAIKYFDTPAGPNLAPLDALAGSGGNRSPGKDGL